MLPVLGLDDLAAAVTEATKHIGQPAPKRSFTGHLTVARFKGSPPSGYRPALEASFAVHEIALVRTEPSGSYTNVKRYGLR